MAKTADASPMFYSSCSTPRLRAGLLPVCVTSGRHALRSLRASQVPPAPAKCMCALWHSDVSFLCVVKTQRRWSNKIYKTELTKTRYNNQVLGKYRVDPRRAGLTLIAELTWSNLGLKGVLNQRK